MKIQRVRSLRARARLPEFRKPYVIYVRQKSRFSSRERWEEVWRRERGGAALLILESLAREGMMDENSREISPRKRIENEN